MSGDLCVHIDQHHRISVNDVISLLRELKRREHHRVVVTEIDLAGTELFDDLFGFDQEDRDRLMRYINGDAIMEMLDDEELLPPESFQDLSLMDQGKFPKLEELDDIVALLGAVNEDASSASALH